MTITNARQYRITAAQLERFTQAITEGEDDLARPISGQEALVRDALLNQAREQASDLRREVEEYEATAVKRSKCKDVGPAERSTQCERSTA